MGSRVFRWALCAALLLPAHAGPVALPENLKPGYGICLFDAEGEIWSQCEGLANEETGVPFSQDTVLRVGGVSELFTVVLALQLVEAGCLDPEEPIAAYLPEVFSGAAPDSTLERVGELKVRLLMSHLSGTGATFFLGFRDYDPFLNLRDYLKDVNLKYPPETKYLQSGAMVDLLGLAVAKLSGTPFEERARTALFEPLGMAASTFRYRESPLFASLRYKSAAPDSYATRIPGFREAVVPSGSLQSSLRDLVAFHSALLRVHGPILSRQSMDALFSPQSEAVAQRQGLRTGLVWKLTLPELAYLGPVAWYSGKHLSHRVVVVLLPERGLGVVCATNAWSIFDRETILPMAIEALKNHCRESLKIQEPPASLPSKVPVPNRLKAQLGGLFASVYGVYRVQPKGNAITVSSWAVESAFEHVGGNVFQAGADDPVEKVLCLPPDTIVFSLRNGMTFEAQRVRPDDRAWSKRRGTYRIAKPQAGALYAFTLGAFEGVPVISGDDGAELLLEPISRERATIRCDESSRFFGKELRVSGPGGLLLDGMPYRLSGPPR